MGAAAKPLGGAIQAGKSTAYQRPLGLTRPLPCASAYRLSVPPGADSAAALRIRAGSGFSENMTFSYFRYERVRLDRLAPV